MTAHPRRLRRTALALPAFLGLLTLAACSGDLGASSSDGGSNDDLSAGVVAPETAARDGADVAPARVVGEKGDQQLQQTAVQQRAVISTGVVSLRSEDVGAALFDVQKVVDEHRGQVTEEESETGDQGELSRSRLVIRVPVAEFDETVADLKGVAELESASTGTEDVTTQVIDTQVRIRAQEKSLERVELLLARAQSIRDIVAIEAQLTRRQAELDSLKGQMAWLADQTSMSTITVHLEEKVDKAQEEDDEDGFLAGLAAGWHGLKTFTSGLATIVGAALPFALVAAVLGIPLWLLVRRSSRARREEAPVAADAG